MEPSQSPKQLVSHSLRTIGKNITPEPELRFRLRQLCDEYPFSSVLRMLHLVACLPYDKQEFESALFSAALSVQDRGRLRELVNAFTPVEERGAAGLPSPDVDPAEQLKDKREKILEDFLKREPRIVADPESSFSESDDLARLSLREDPDLVSETLARIYALQGNKDKARKIYEKLCLKYPEKSAYFAALISGLSSAGSAESDNKQTD